MASLLEAEQTIVNGEGTVSAPVDQILAVIDGSPAFADLPPAARRALAGICHEVRFSTGQRLVSITQPLTRVFILASGRAKLAGVTENGLERILNVYHPGEIIGSRILLKESPESPFEVVAISDVRALTIAKRDFLAVGQEHPEILSRVTQVLLKRIDRLADWMLAAMSNDATVRLAKLLLDFAADQDVGDGELVELKHPLTHETMAQMIGASRPHTTSLLGTLEQRRAIRRLKPRGLLVSPPRLKAILQQSGERDQAI